MGIEKTKRHRHALTFTAAALAIVLWSSAFAATRYVLEYYSPRSVMLLRFTVASVTLAIISGVKGIRPPKLRQLPKFAAGGFIGIFCYMLFFNTGMVHVESGIGGFIIATVPIFTIILSRILLKEKVGLVCWAGVIVSFGGLVVIMLSQTAAFELNTSALLILLAAMCGSGHNIIQRGLLKSHTALETTTYCMIAATICMLVFLPGFFRELPGSGLRVNLVVVFLGVFPAAIAYLLWGYALSKAEKTTHVTVFLYLNPFLASLIAYLWLRETFSIWSFFGGIIIIGGMIMTNFTRKTVTDQNR